MEWVRSRVSLQQQLREDDRIPEPRGRRVTANVAVGQLLWGAYLFPFFYVAEVASVRGECMTWGKKGEVQQRENSPCSFGLETPEMLLDRITRIWRRSKETDGVRQKLPLSWTPRGELFRNDNIYKSYWFPFSCCHPSFAHCNSVMLYKNFIKLDRTNRVWTQLKISC